jgi:putative addiction module killer protein
MLVVRRTPDFQKWIDNLGDKRGAARILSRIYRAREGNFGDTRPVGNGISEMRIHHGPGYRVYYFIEGQQIVVLLCGGDKSSQARDIEKAKAMALTWRGR